MKNFIRKSAVIASFLAVCATSFTTRAQEKPVYDKAFNTSIGVTIPDATGAGYTIKDSKGNVVLQGQVKSSKTFYIPISKLGAGSYRFCIGCLVLQEFAVK